MRRFWPFFIVLVIAIIAIMFSNTEPQQTVSVSDNMPKRVISISPSITEMAYAIGLGDNMIAVSDYCDFPAAANLLPKVGGFINPNIEAIVRLKPDLVMLPLSNSRLIKKLDQLGINSLTIDSSNIKSIKNSILTMGKLTGHEQQASQVISEFEQTAEIIHQKIQNETTPSVLLVMGHSKNSANVGNIFVAGQHGFYNDLIELAGGINAFTNKSLKIGNLSKEGILALNPDIIVDVFPEADDHNYDLANVKRQWQSLSQLNAVKNNRVHIIEESYATIPGPRLVLLQAQLAQLFHPQLDWQSP